MTLDILREQTRQAHTALEKIIVPHIKNATRESYAQLLRIFYGYYKPVEDLIDTYIDDQTIPNYTDRRKAATILDDIKEMTGDNAVPQLCSHLPAITDVYRALGAMYVLEGSTLGGKIIGKMLTSNLQLTNDNGIKFFSGYGPGSDAMWASFITALNNYLASQQQQEEIAAAATDTFTSFKAWIEACTQ